VKIAAVFSLLLLAANANAQLASDRVPHERVLPISEEIRHQLESSRFRFGVFRLQPTIGIKDLGYDNNVFGTTDSVDPVADWHASVAAGTSFIVPGGTKMYLRGMLIPEYTYYQKLASRRSWGGEYGASLLGLFNRMTVEAGVHSLTQLQSVNSEIERPALGTRTDLPVNLEIEIFRRLSVFGTGQAEHQRYDLNVDPTLRTLERNETLGRGGLRYHFTSYFDISAAAEKTTTKFLVNDTRNNESNAFIVGVHYDRPRSYINLSIGQREGKGAGSESGVSTFPRFSETTGSYYAFHELSSGITLDVYGARGVEYSLTVQNPYFIDTRNGAGITLPVGHRVALRAFGEMGPNSYPIPVNGVKRTDDVTTWGGGFSMRLYRNFVLSTIASNTKYDSTIDLNNRSVFRVTTIVTASTGFFR
jgi:hypothetical protein